ncbi:hypothetical protein BDQ17DRAFT_329972 [Cyathus striatus]|nr:hypothetical protein BDQ17DRAFT_329972 [Cyathus striatus]
MSKPRAVQSGLGSVQRNWSESSVVSQPKSSQEFTWPPTPPGTGDAPHKKLTGPEQRLKDIQDALAGLPSKPKSKPLEESRALNKRTTPDSLSSISMHPPKKPRQLPQGWEEDSLSSSSFNSKLQTPDHPIAPLLLMPLRLYPPYQ